MWFAAERKYIHIGLKEIDRHGNKNQHHAWHPGRLRFLQPLIKAYKALRDERYAQAARDYVADWCRAHPERENWFPQKSDNTLDIAGRNLFWGLAIDAFIDIPLGMKRF